MFPLARLPVGVARRGRLAVVALSALLGPGSVPWAQRTQRSAPPSAPVDAVVTAQVLTWRVSPDGSFLVYSAKAGGPVGLVRAELGGSGATRDLGVEVLDGFAFQIDPSGAWIVFLGRVNGRSGLFSVPSDGSAPAVRLDPSGVESGVESDLGGTYQITPDGTRVAYMGTLGNNQRQLFSVPIQGGAAVQVNAPLPRRGNVLSFQVGPDSRRVLYTASTFAGSGHDLYVGSLSGRQPAVRLSQAHPPGRSVTRYAISASRQEVVYASDLSTFRRFELYAVSLLGGEPRLLSQPLVDIGVRDFALTPDGKAVVYNAPVTSETELDLFRVPLAGGLPVELDAGLPGHVRAFQVVGPRVVFLLTPSNFGSGQLFAVPADGSQPAVRIDLNGGGSFYVAPGGSVAVYEKGLALFSTGLDGSRPPERLGVIGLSDFLRGYGGFDARGTRMVYGLTSYRVDGQGEPLFLGGAEVEGQSVGGRTSGELVLYLASRQESGNTITDLYRVPVDGSAAAVRVNAPFPPALVADAADADAESARDGSPSPAVITASGTPLEITPDAARLLYLVPEGAVYALWSLSLDGSAPAARFEGTLGMGPFLVKPD